MILLDTCALIFDALSPERFTRDGRTALDEAERAGALVCSDISLWEIAMLVRKGRLDPGTDSLTFLQATLAARSIRVLPITPEIAALSVSLPGVEHQDPADRIIAATTVHHSAVLLTCDATLLDAPGVPTLW